MGNTRAAIQRNSILRLLPFLEDHRLQGTVFSKAALDLLLGPPGSGLRVFPGTGSCPLLHKHLSQLGQGTAASTAGSQCELLPFYLLLRFFFSVKGKSGGAENVISLHERAVSR